MHSFINKLLFFLSSFFTKGHPRTLKAKRQVIYSFALQALSIAVGLLYVPLLIDYLDVERYGIWLTLTSIVGWFSVFDVGLGNGLRNKLCEAIALGNTKLAKEYVSTTYGIIVLIFCFVLIIFYSINPVLNWSSILNTVSVPSNELSLLSLIVFTFFFLQFIFKIIGNILMAHQLIAINNLFGPLGNIISIIIIYLITLFTKGQFVLLGFILSAAPLIVLIIATVILFHGRFRDLKPNIKFIRRAHINQLMGLGIKFFAIQISALVMFSLSNFIIIQFLGGEQVSLYNIAFKYFQLPVMIYSIIISPVWSAVTDAFVLKEYGWLKQTLKYLNQLSLLFVVIVLLMLLFSNYVYSLWLGERVSIPLNLSISMALYAIINITLSPFSSFINGLGKLSLSVRIIFFKVVLFIPFAIYLINTNLGASGVMFATCLFNGINFPIFYLQVKKIISGKAEGIWNK